jgi:hypothetical protein
MVLSVFVIQLTSGLNQNATSLSFVALDKSIKASDEYSSTTSSKALVLSRKRKKQTVAIDFNVFKGIRTPLHQSHCPLIVFLETPGEHEFPKVDAVR